MKFVKQTGKTLDKPLSQIWLSKKIRLIIKICCYFQYFCEFPFRLMPLSSVVHGGYMLDS